MEHSLCLRLCLEEEDEYSRIWHHPWCPVTWALRREMPCEQFSLSRMAWERDGRNSDGCESFWWWCSSKGRGKQNTRTVEKATFEWVIKSWGRGSFTVMKNCSFGRSVERLRHPWTWSDWGIHEYGQTEVSMNMVSPSHAVTTETAVLMNVQRFQVKISRILKTTTLLLLKR
jgi:hypothetical protein